MEREFFCEGVICDTLHVVLPCILHVYMYITTYQPCGQFTSMWQVSQDATEGGLLRLGYEPTCGQIGGLGQLSADDFTLEA